MGHERSRTRADDECRRRCQTSAIRGRHRRIPRETTRIRRTIRRNRETTWNRSRLLRTRQRRMSAHPPTRKSEAIRWHRYHVRYRGRDLRPRTRVRRLPQRRTRRWHRSRRMGREDVRNRTRWQVQRCQATLRPRRNHEPRQSLRHARHASQPTLRYRIPDRTRAYPTRLPRRWRICRRDRAVQWRRCMPQTQRWRNVPVIHGNSRRRTLHARTCERPPRRNLQRNTHQPTHIATHARCP